MAASDVPASIFDIAGIDAQFTGMLLGAFLASAGGFMVTWLLDRMEQKRQQRSIALVCLDLLTSLSVMIHLAANARGRGDPYGPFTMRLVRGCLRDLDVYERNRERIADIRDPDIRAEIYTCMARLSLSVDGVSGEHEIIQRLDEEIAAARLAGDAARVEDLSAQRSERATRRDASFDFLIETSKDVGDPLAAKLRKVANADAQNLFEIVQRQTAVAVQPASDSTKNGAG